jgi:hypothetical protein
MFYSLLKPHHSFVYALYIYRALVGKPEGKKPLGRPSRRCEDNTKIDIQEVRWWSMDWIELAQDRDRRWALVNVIMNLQIP